MYVRKPRMKGFGKMAVCLSLMGRRSRLRRAGRVPGLLSHPVPPLLCHSSGAGFPPSVASWPITAAYAPAVTHVSDREVGGRENKGGVAAPPGEPGPFGDPSSRLHQALVLASRWPERVGEKRFGASPASAQRRTRGARFIWVAVCQRARLLAFPEGDP